MSDSCVRFCAVYCRQDRDITKEFLTQLKSENPKLYLVFCTSSVGMGLFSPPVTRVIDASPPGRMTDFFQEIGHAGRKGLDSQSY